MNRTTETAAKIIESLPQKDQEKAIQMLRQLAEEAGAERRWEELFDCSQEKLKKIAKRAEQEIKAKKARPLDLEHL